MARDRRTTARTCGFDCSVVWNVTGCLSQRHREPSPDGVRFSFFSTQHGAQRKSLVHFPVASPCPWLLLSFCPTLLGSLCLSPVPSTIRSAPPAAGRERRRVTGSSGHSPFKDLSPAPTKCRGLSSHRPEVCHVSTLDVKEVGKDF